MGGGCKALLRRLKSLIKRLLTLTSIIKGGDGAPSAKATIEQRIQENADNLDWIYRRLEDDTSKNLLISLMAYRTLGYRKVKLPLNTTEYWATLEQLETEMKNGEKLDTGFAGWKLSRVDLGRYGYPMEVFARPSGVFTQLLQQQYRCITDQETTIEASPGDVVMDCGGCWGETALYFAHKVSPSGRVFTFEFLPANLSILRKNLSLNHQLACIETVEHPVWSENDVKLYIHGNGPGTKVSFDQKHPHDPTVTTISIDDLARAKNLASVDFIKMDIEGAELEALKGAESTIRAYRPKLAISVYHKLEDFWTIAQWIDSLGLGYRFWLRHFTIHKEETVLFALSGGQHQQSRP